MEYLRNPYTIFEPIHRIFSGSCLRQLLGACLGASCRPLGVLVSRPSRLLKLGVASGGLSSLGVPSCQPTSLSSHSGCLSWPRKNYSIYRFGNWKYSIYRFGNCVFCRDFKSSIYLRMPSRRRDLECLGVCCNPSKLWAFRGYVIGIIFMTGTPGPSCRSSPI